MKQTIAATLLAVSALTPAGQARAQDMTFVGLTWASDYIVGGFSLNEGRPALQGYVEHNFSSGIYAGFWATQTDIGTDDRVEMDLYLGYRGAVRTLSYDISYYSYVYEKSGFDYPEAIAKLDWSVIDGVALGAKLRAPFGGLYEDEFMYGPTLTLTPTERTTIKAEYMSNTADDLNDWNISIRQQLTPTVGLSLTYWENDVVGSTVVGAVHFDTAVASLFGG